MTAFEARFDESGIEGTRSVAAYAGYCASSQTWRRLEKAWLQALDDFQIPQFHMVDLIHSRNGFEKFDRHLVGLLLNRLKSILVRELKAKKLLPLWSAVEKFAWDKVDKPEKFLSRFPKPLDVCFDHLVHQLARCSSGRGSVTPIFALNDEYNKRNEDVYNVYRQHADWNALLGPIAFDSPQRLTSLQPADMIAYEISAYWDRLDEGDYFRRMIDLRYSPLVDEIAPLIEVELSGCIGEIPLKRIIRDYLDGQLVW